MSDADPKFVSVPVTEERIREMLRGDRDFHVQTTEKCEVSAVCLACAAYLDIAQDAGLLWFRCPSCRRVSFNPVANHQRDAHFAHKDGRPFAYELFFLKEIPPQFRSPFKSDVSPQAGDGAVER
jgi:hypothetical protein